ncbi:RNA-directed DNA polymerase (Reverse transcriptase), partial [Trifolium medium]|nr:RNA-directed DNA polymerase (Reverse transcriptase) [Trifolium medium]
VFGNLNRRIELVVEEIKNLDMSTKLSLISQDDIEDRHKAFVELWDLMRCKEILLFQRSRSKCIKEGDENTKYFHASIKSSDRKNSILKLMVEDRWVESVSEVRAEVVECFSRHYQKMFLIARP